MRGLHVQLGFVVLDYFSDAWSLVALGLRHASDGTVVAVMSAVLRMMRLSIALAHGHVMCWRIASVVIVAV